MTLPPPLLGFQRKVSVCLGLKLPAITVAVTGSPTTTSFGCTEQVAAGATLPLAYSHGYPAKRSHWEVESLGANTRLAKARLERSDTARTINIPVTTRPLFRLDPTDILASKDSCRFLGWVR